MKYSIDEIDIMRNCVVVLHNGKDAEQRLRTYMLNGTDAQDLIDRAAAMLENWWADYLSTRPGSKFTGYVLEERLRGIKEGIIDPSTLDLTMIPEGQRERAQLGIAGRLRRDR